MKNLKSILFILILGVLSLTMVQDQLQLFTFKKLEGATPPTVDTVVTLKGWFSGTYQQKKQQYLNNAFGMRNLAIRTYNQVTFSLFKEVKVKGCVVGKEDYLYEQPYIDAYMGNDFVGEDKIREKIEKLKFIQDTLAKLGKNIFVVFNVGKASFYPEYFPARYDGKQPGKTNYQACVEAAKDRGIQYIDFNKYFINKKKSSPYVLYPKYGIHWSTYAATLAMDSIIRYIERLQHIDMPNVSWKGVKVDTASINDSDMGRGLNLLIPLPFQQTAYPQLIFEDDKGKAKPHLMVIGDSFYTTLRGLDIKRFFTDPDFWFYYSEIYYENLDHAVSPSTKNLKDEMNNHDLFMIMDTEFNLSNLGHGFIEDAYLLFHKDKQIEKEPVVVSNLDSMIHLIKATPSWLKMVEAKAKQNNIPLDSMVKIDAQWTIQEEAKKASSHHQK